MSICSYVRMKGLFNTNTRWSILKYSLCCSIHEYITMAPSISSQWPCWVDIATKGINKLIKYIPQYSFRHTPLIFPKNVFVNISEILRLVGMQELRYSPIAIWLVSAQDVPYALILWYVTKIIYLLYWADKKPDHVFQGPCISSVIIRAILLIF